MLADTTGPAAAGHTSKGKLPQFPVTAPGWLYTSVEETPPALCSDPVMSSQAQQPAGDLAPQMKNANYVTATFYTAHSLK